MGAVALFLKQTPYKLMKFVALWVIMKRLLSTPQDKQQPRVRQGALRHFLNLCLYLQSYCVIPRVHLEWRRFQAVTAGHCLALFHLSFAGFALCFSFPPTCSRVPSLSIQQKQSEASLFRTASHSLFLFEGRITCSICSC